jgi:2-oxoglutarate ferredoxin oxidoreductase subunit alpha
MKLVYSVKIAGEAGQGIKSSGLNLSQYLNNLGFFIYNYLEYPSLIRGGHNVSQVIFSENPVRSPRKTINALIALDQPSLNLHVSELSEKGLAIFDSESNLNLPTNPNVSFVGVPLKKLGRESGAGDIAQNTVAQGALVYLLGGDIESFDKLIETQFAKKPEFITTNQKAFESGFNFASQNFASLKQSVIRKLTSDISHVVLDGNETMAQGAIDGGLNFSAIYPMSPISNMLTNLAKDKEKYSYILKQAEDEISAINMCIGASYAGARSLTATSGGGFALMSEALGLSAMTETPLVIVEGMRGAPATGLPTWSEQGDLRFVLHAHQGDIPRIVLTPADAEEAYYATRSALNLAAKYQCPVIVVVDKNICDHSQTLSPFKTDDFKIDNGQVVNQIEEGYERYKLTPNGISPRSFAGSGNFFVTNSDEHDSLGFSSEEIKDRNEQQNKRLQKIYSYEEQDFSKPILHGPVDAELTIVGWGSTKGPILDALENFPNVNFLQITQVAPFPAKEVTAILSKAKHIINIENNSTAQMAGLIREKTGLNITDMYLKNDGRPFFPEDIIAKIQSVIASVARQSIQIKPVIPA